MSSTNYHLVPTLGQSTPVENSSSSNFGLDAGFWYTVLLFAVGDVNGDGRIGLGEAFMILRKLADI